MSDLTMDTKDYHTDEEVWTDFKNFFHPPGPGSFWERLWCGLPRVVDISGRLGGPLGQFASFFPVCRPEVQINFQRIGEKVPEAYRRAVVVVWLHEMTHWLQWLFQTRLWQEFEYGTAGSTYWRDIRNKQLPPLEVWPMRVSRAAGFCLGISIASISEMEDWQEAEE